MVDEIRRIIISPVVAKTIGYNYKACCLYYDGPDTIVVFGSGGIRVALVSMGVGREMSYHIHTKHAKHFAAHGLPGAYQIDVPIDHGDGLISVRLERSHRPIFSDS